MGRKDMVSSSAPRGRMCLYTSPRFRRTATVRSTRAKPWSLICSKAPKASRRQTLCAHKPVGEAIHQPSRTQREGLFLGGNRVGVQEISLQGETLAGGSFEMPVG